MTINNSVLKTVREAIGLDPEEKSFDPELLIHINTALSTLIQNGVGTPRTIIDETQTWDDVKSSEQFYADEMFEQVKHYVFLRTKLIFDPPPPSTAKYMSQATDETLWRLREAYDILRKEEPVDGSTTTPRS